MVRPAPAALSWALILLAAAGMASSPYWLQPPDREQDSAATLVILTMQSRMLTGVSLFAPAQVERELPQLDAFAATAPVARALAGMNLYLGGESGRKRALGMLDRHGEFDDPQEAQLHALVRRTVEGEQPPDAAERERLVGELGWFGKQLVASGAPDDDPLRDEIRRAGLRAFAVLLAMLAGGGFALVVGLVLLVVAAIARSRGGLRAAFEASNAHAGFYLEAFAAYMTVLLFFDVLLPAAGLMHPAQGIAAVIFGSLLGAAWPWLRGVPLGDALAGLGLHRGRGVWREMGAGIVGYVAALPIVAVGFGMTLILISMSDLLLPADPDAPPELISHPVAVWMAHGSLGVRLLVLFLASAFAPFFEEILFRGAFYRALRARFGVPLSAIVMAVVFAVIHPQGILLVPALGALAVGFALIREWRDSLIAPMLAHAGHNGALVCFMWIMFG